ncbi:uncharacterized protein [Eucyclogobius newberryi]|uniref:uncharacterized protein n=1 Tax=Eucyclogobius newberryi TaxID=166745 RepID=UPI003B5BF2A7
MCERSLALRALVNARLTAAAEEIFALVERTIAEYEEELCRSKEENQRNQQLLDSVLSLRAEDPSTESTSSSWRRSLCDFPQIKEERGPDVECKEERPESCVVAQEQTHDFTEHVQKVLQSWGIPQSGTGLDHLRSGTGPDHLHLRSGTGPDHLHLRSGTGPDHLRSGTGPDHLHLRSGTGPDHLHLRSGTGPDHLRSGTGPDHLHLRSFTFPHVNPDENDETWTENGNDGRNDGGNVARRRNCGAQILFCSVCDKRFRRTHELRRHELTHEAKPYSCSLCKKSFAREDSVQFHMALHTGTQLFHCQLCHKPFTRSNGLRNHMLTIHAQRKPFSCSFCQREFSTKDSLKKHVFLHTGNKPFRCSFCDKSYTRRQQLKLHMSDHHGEGTSRK